MTFERYLMDIHADQYGGLDDEMIDDFEEWLMDCDMYSLIGYAEAWHKQENTKKGA